MAWHYSDENEQEVTHDGQVYVVQDMGSDGHCLFRSLALVLAIAGEDDLPYDRLRAMVVDTLINWVIGGLPHWFDAHHYPAPTVERIGQLVSGDWGDSSCMVALLAHSYPHCRIIVLNDSSDAFPREWPLDVSTSGTGDPVKTVRILWVSLAHYVALVPKGQVAAIAVKTASLVDLEPAEFTKVASVKLSTVSGLSSSLNTRHHCGIALEIHQIDVGIGDAALILVKRDDDYVQSIMVDCGQFVEAVSGYLDHLISLKRFRPIDVFIASHYDKDHIGAAPIILLDKRYASPELTLYDPGEPAMADSDYAAYKKAFGEANQKGRRTADLENPLFTVGTLHVRVVGMNGLYRGTSPGEYLSVLEHIDGPVPKSLIEGKEDQMQWTLQALAPSTLFPTDKNKCSMAVLVEFGHFRYFTAGDLHGDLEDKLVQHVFDRYLGSGTSHVCACKLNHHGAREATSGRMLALLRPALCLVSCGTPNTHGHPSPTTLDRVAQLHQVYPSHVLVTADLDVAATDSERPWARPPLTGHVRHAQGSIVILADESWVQHERKHGFQVLSSVDARPVFRLCGSRPYVDTLAIVDRIKPPQKSKTSKEASASRKKSRLEEVEAERQEIRDAARLQLLEALGNLIDHIDDRSMREMMRQEMLGGLDALVERLMARDASLHSKRIGTLVKNFRKEIDGGGLREPGQLSKFLAGHG